MTALSGPDGKFTLKNVPVGDNIPLVIQIGRWRRQVKIPKVKACVNTPLDAELTRLPRNKTEGDIPLMAIEMGDYDPLECLLRKIGIDDSEFTPPSGTGRIHMYGYGRIAGVQTPAESALTASTPVLSKYDIVLLPCDSFPTRRTAISGYAAMGGRLFLTDLSYDWISQDFRETVTERSSLNSLENFTGIVDQTFPKGKIFAEWLTIVGASRTLGMLPVRGYQDTMIGGVVPPTQRWLYTGGSIKSIQHLTFNTPVGAAPDQQCGRVVYSNFHVVHQMGRGTSFPSFCPNTPLTPQEKALEFMLFDVGSCILPDSETPQPPRVFDPPPEAPKPPPPPPIVIE